MHIIYKKIINYFKHIDLVSIKQTLYIYFDRDYLPFGSVIITPLNIIGYPLSLPLKMCTTN